MINKKGTGYIILFFGFMFLMVIILTGITIGVGAFFNTNYDFRAAESEILFSYASDCLNEFGETIFDDNFSISNCELNENVLNDSHLVLIRDLNSEKEFFIGVYDYQTQCFLKGSKKNKNFPKCIKKNVGDFEVIVGSGQKAEKQRFLKNV